LEVRAVRRDTPEAEGAQDSASGPASQSPTSNKAAATSSAPARDGTSLHADSAAPAKTSPVLTSGKSGASKKHDVDALFENPTLLNIEITIPESGVNELRQSRREGGHRPVAKATVREGDQVYTNVAVHLKGSAGSFRPIDNKPALTLKFDKFVEGQSFHGLHKISLNNSVQDGSFLCEKIARELFIAAGVPAPRASHALVQLNGKDQGLYVLLEGANKQFLKRYFNDPNGNLYDGGFCREISTRLQVNCGEDQNNHSGLRALCATLRGGHPTYAQLEKVLDVDRFVSMMAMEMMLCHWDGYTLNKNNWRVFHDRESNRMVFIPHGLDQLFGAGRQFDPQHVSGAVSTAVLATPEGQRQYEERVAQLYTNVFKVDQIVARVDQLGAGISSALAETHPQLARSFQQRAGSLKSRIIRRGEALRRQLGAPAAPSAEFAKSGVLDLNGWKPSIMQSGEPVLSEKNDQTGRRVLSIAAGESPSSGSWRVRVMLGPGRYQFQGRARVESVAVAAGDQRGGAGLRISKGPMPRKLTGTSDWQECKYTYEVSEEATDDEMICELKATGGEAWFDASSLRLVQVH
jgi:spore coat protein CotH